MLTIHAPRLEGRQDEELALLGCITEAAAAGIPACRHMSAQTQGQAGSNVGAFCCCHEV
jgi:hypothetical protein